MPMNPIEAMGLEVAILPKDITGAAQTGDWVSLKGYQGCLIVLLQGAWAGGTSAVTVEQATDVAGTSNKAVSFTKRWTKVGVTGTTWAETAVTSNTFDLPATANTMNAIYVPAASLDVDGGFDCLTVKAASPGANADLLSAFYLLVGARYAAAAMPDAKVD
jgi:hypothetical protein